jgi:predicted CoA-binding protein
MKHPDFSLDETYVIFGVSRSCKGFGYMVAESMEQRGYSFYIVHPEAEQIEGWTPVRHVRELPEKPNAAILCSPRDQSRRILEELYQADILRVYAAAGTVDNVGRAYARDHGVWLCEECPLLHVRNMGFPHNLHRRLAMIFGK